MVKKLFTITVEVTVPISYTKSFEITKEVDFDDERMKEEELSEEEYIEENYEDFFFEEAERLMDKDKELDKIDVCDLDFGDYSCDFDY